MIKYHNPPIFYSLYQDKAPEYIEDYQKPELEKVTANEVDKKGVVKVYSVLNRRICIKWEFIINVIVKY